MNDLILLRGLPGSGKTTLANKITRAVCSADDYYIDREGNYNWDAIKIGAAHKWCQRKCEKFLKAGIPIVAVANTSTTTKEIKIYQDLAKKYNYRIFSTIVENRHGGKNVHDVPEETLKKMEARFNIKLI